MSTGALHDALPISSKGKFVAIVDEGADGDEEERDERVPKREEARERLMGVVRLVDEEARAPPPASGRVRRDRKSTRLNSSHRCISYGVFCLTKKTISQGYRPLHSMFTTEGDSRSTAAV